MCHLPQLRYRRSGRTSLCSRRAFRSAKVLQLQKQTCQKLWPLRALEFEARLLLPSSFFHNKSLSYQSAYGGQRVDLPPKNLIFQNSAQTAFKSLRLLRRRLDLKSGLRSETSSSQPSLRDGTLIFKTSGGARAAVRKTS